MKAEVQAGRRWRVQGLKPGIQPGVKVESLSAASGRSHGWAAGLGLFGWLALSLATPGSVGLYAGEEHWPELTPAPVAAQPGTEPLYQDDPLEAPEVYARRLQQLTAAERADKSVVAALQFNRILAYRKAESPRRVLDLLPALIELRPNDFNLRCLLVESLGQIHAADADLVPPIQGLIALAGDDLTRQIRVVHLIESLPEDVRPLQLAGEIIEKGMYAAEQARQWEAFWGWTRLEDERLALTQDTALRLKLWEYPLRRKMPLGRLRLREARARILALEDADLVRPEAQQFWLGEFQDLRADWPADAPTTADRDRLACLEAYLDTFEPGAALPPSAFSKMQAALAQFVMGCGELDRLAAMTVYMEWLDGMAKEPSLVTAVTTVRRDLCQQIIAHPKATGAELLAAGEGLMACLKADLARADLTAQALSEQTFAAVVAFDRADKAGVPAGMQGLRAVLEAIAISGEDPDVKRERAPRYFMLYDYARLLADKSVSLEAARAFRGFKASKMPAWQATLEVLALAAKNHAPAATIAGLIDEGGFPPLATGEVEPALLQLCAEYRQDPLVGMAAVRSLLGLERWDSAAQVMTALAALKPSGEFNADVASARGLLQAQPQTLAEQLPAETEQILVAAFQIAPVDSFVRNDAALALSQLQYAQGRVADAEATLQAWWDRSSTSQALRSAAMERVNLTLVKEHNLAGARDLYAALRKRLPGDPVSRLVVLQEILRALADSGAMEEYKNLAGQELADATLPAELREQLLNLRADEMIVQGDIAGALADRWTALEVARAAGLKAPLYTIPSVARRMFLTGILDRMTADLAKFPAAAKAFEATALTHLDPVDHDPVVGLAVADAMHRSGRLAEEAALRARLADERPWDGGLSHAAARSARAAGDKAGALQRFRVLSDRYPGDADIRFHMIDLGLETGDRSVVLEQVDQLMHFRGRVDFAALGGRLVERGRSDLLLTMIEQQQKNTGHVDDQEVRFVAGLHAGQGRLEQAVAELAKFAAARAQERKYTRGLRLIGDLHVFIEAWYLDPAGETAVIAALARAEKILAPAAEFEGDRGTADLAPEVALAIQELRLAQADLLLKQNQTEAALRCVAVPAPEDFDLLMSHFQGQAAFRASLCEKCLVTPPVGNPAYETKLHIALALAYEQTGRRDRVLVPYQWLVDHAKPAEKRDWQEHFARLLLSQNRWQEALDLYFPLAQDGVSAAPAVAVWRILRDHSEARVRVAGEDISRDDFLLAMLARRPGRANIVYHRSLRDEMLSAGNLPLAEILARTVLAEVLVTNRDADRSLLLTILERANQPEKALEFLDAEAQTPQHRASLQALLPTYLTLLKTAKRYNRAAVEASPYLRSQPAAEVWHELVAQASRDQAQWLAFIDLGFDGESLFDAAFYTAQLRMGPVDPAITGLLESPTLDGPPATWGVFKRPVWWQAMVADLLRERAPELAVLIDARLAAPAPGSARLTLDSTHAALRLASTLVTLERNREAAAVFAGLNFDPAGGAKEAKGLAVPASLQETVRMAYFRFLTQTQRDFVQAQVLLPNTRRPGSLAMRQALWSELRAAGNFRACLKEMDAALKWELLQTMPDALRREMIYDLLAASVDLSGATGTAAATSAGDAPGRSQFRNQAFQLALEALRNAEFDLRRPPRTGNTEDNRNDQLFFQWLYILRNISRYDPAQRSDLNATLWALVKSEPAGSSRVVRGILQSIGDLEGDAGRLKAIQKVMEIHAGPEAFANTRLELLRRLKQQDEVIAMLREAQAAAPADLEALHALAQELNGSTVDNHRTEAVALWGRLIAALDSRDAESLAGWARRLEGTGYSDIALRLSRMAWRASPSLDTTQLYARMLVAQDQGDEAITACLQSLFVREWRAKEGNAQFREVEVPCFGQALVEALNRADLFPAALREVEGALTHPISLRHRAQLLLAQFELRAALDRRSDALAGLQALLVEDFPQRPLILQALDMRVSARQWKIEGPQWLFTRAKLEPLGAGRAAKLQAAGQALENAGLLADAVTAYQLTVAASAKEADLSDLQRRLGKMLYDLKREPEALAAFNAAQSAGAMLSRYNTWQTWRALYRDDAKPTDTALTLAEFPNWAAQMTTANERATVLRDYRQWLEAQRRIDEACEVCKKQLESADAPNKSEVRQAYVQLLLRRKKFTEASEQIGIGLKDNSISVYNVSAAYQPVLRPMTADAAAEWIMTTFKPYDLPWYIMTQFANYCIPDYTLRQRAITRMAELRLAEHPDDRQVLQQALRDLCGMGEYDRAIRLVAAAEATMAVPPPGAKGGYGARELRGWLAGELANNNCLEQAIQRIEPLRDQAPPRSWARAQFNQELAELYLNAGRPDEAVAVWTSTRNDAGGYQQFRRAAEERLFQYQMNWARDGAAAEKLYREALAERPSSPSTLAMLTQLIGFHRTAARNDKCSELLQARIDAAVLLTTERDDLILNRVQTEIDALTASSPEPGAALIDPVFQVFCRSYQRLVRNLAPGARDNLFDRSRTMLVRLWTRSKSAAQWRNYEPRLQALADQERPDSARISELRLDVFRRREEREKVADELARRFAREPENVSLHNQLIQAHVEARQYSAAAAMLQADLTARPADHRPAFALVDLYLAADRREAAEAAWKVALPLAPDNAGDLSRLGQHYEDRRRFDWALELYRRAQRREPSLGAADNLARMGEKMEAPLESVQVYLAYFDGLFRGPDAAAPSVDYSLAERMAPYARFERDFDQAVKLIEAARAAAPQAAHRALLTVALAELQAMRRRQSAALDLYQQALQGEFAGKAELVLYLLQRLPTRNATPAALELARATVKHPAFATQYAWAQRMRIVQSYTGLAGLDADRVELDTAWSRLLESAPADQFVGLCRSSAQRLSARHDPVGACALLDQALAVEKRFGERKQLMAQQIGCWEAEKKWRTAAELGDRLCQAQMAAQDDSISQTLSQNLARWLRVPDVAAAAALVRTVAASPAISTNARATCYQRVFSTLENRPIEENLDEPLAALLGFLPEAKRWRLNLAIARRLGRRDVEAGLAWIEKNRSSLPDDAAQWEALDAEIDILTISGRKGQAANRWRDALKTWGDRLPRGRERSIELFTQAGRYDQALDQCLTILQGPDSDMARQIEGQLRSIGYQLQNSKDRARVKQFGDAVEATLALHDPQLSGGVSEIWVQILRSQRRSNEVMEFAKRAAAALPVESYQRRNLLDQAFNELYQLLFNNEHAKLPRPTQEQVVELFKLAVLPALDSSAYQANGNYLTAIAEKMNLESAFANLIVTAAADRAQQTSRPMAVHLRAGDLIRNFISSQLPLAVAEWRAALAAHSPARAVLLRSLRDAALAQPDNLAALEYQTGLLKLQPWDFEFRSEYAAILTRLNRTAAADQAWLEAGKLAESSEDQLYQLAEKMRSVSRVEASIEIYKKSFDLAKRRGSLNSWRRSAVVGGLTRAEWDLKKREQAFKFWGDGLARIARYDSYHTQLMNTLVELLAAAPDLAQIITDYEKDGRPSGLENGNLRDAFGQAWQRKSESAPWGPERRALEDKALANLAIAADVLPQEPRVRERIIDIHSRRGNEKPQMIEQYRELSRNDPKNISYYERMGYLYKEMGRPAEMEKAWSMILEALPREGAGHRRLAEIFAGEKQFARAVAEAQAVVDNRPEDPASYILLGTMQTRNGQFAEAEAALAGVLARGEEWKAKRYNDGEWKNPADQGLLELYSTWVRQTLRANDAAGSAKVRDRAHRQPGVVNMLRQSALPARDESQTVEEANARVAAWQYLRQNLPAPGATPPAFTTDPAPPEEEEPVVEEMVVE